MKAFTVVSTVVTEHKRRANATRRVVRGELELAQIVQASRAEVDAWVRALSLDRRRGCDAEDEWQESEDRLEHGERGGLAGWLVG